MVVADLEFTNSHITCGDGPGLANANIMEHCASLDTLNVLDEDVILLKLVDRKSHSN